jgi:hypothetical protein
MASIIVLPVKLAVLPLLHRPSTPALVFPFFAIWSQSSLFAAVPCTALSSLSQLSCCWRCRCFWLASWLHLQPCNHHCPSITMALPPLLLLPLLFLHLLLFSQLPLMTCLLVSCSAWCIFVCHDLVPLHFSSLNFCPGCSSPRWPTRLPERDILCVLLQRV